MKKFALLIMIGNALLIPLSIVPELDILMLLISISIFLFLYLDIFILKNYN